MQNWFGQQPNESLAFVSVVVGATNDIEAIPSMVKKAKQDTRNRVKAGRRKDGRWNEVYLNGWFETDALGAEHIPLLPPQRRKLVEEIAPFGFDTAGPIWLPSWHGIIYLNGLSAEQATSEFTEQWSANRQVHVEPFDLSLPVSTNLANVTAYSNKFDPSITLRDRVVELWPSSWEAQFFGCLNSAFRNPWEGLRMAIGQSQCPPSSSPDAFEKDSDDEEMMPFMCSVTEVPMYYSTGPLRWA